MKLLSAFALSLATALVLIRPLAAAPADLAAPDRAAPPLSDLLAAQPGEPPLFPRLRGLRFLADPHQLADPGFPADGVNATRVPVLNAGGIRIATLPFMNAPASQASLERLADAVRAYLRFHDRPFAAVYLPPQDVTGGYVQLVVAEARSDGPAAVVGAKHFPATAYRGLLRQSADAPIDATLAQADLAWINRNPFRHAVLAAQTGRQPGTTNLVLRVDDRFPLSLNAGYANTGTKMTDEDRISAGVTWGNAFGRGDLLNLGLSGDPAWHHARSSNAAYTAFLPWRHVLTLFAAYSAIKSMMPEPFTQSGTSWQAGARYELPLPTPRPGWTQALSFTADFKYSDNTLEFAAIPITGNVTHIAQVGGSYGLTFPALGGQNEVRLEGEASPGGLTGANHDAAFAGSRPGAKAEYAYAKLGLRHQRALVAGCTLALSADAQWVTGALLGTEQLNGGGSAAVRGYRESSAFGDGGVVGSAELHAPAFAALQRRDRVDLFAFVDAASLRLLGDHDGTDLASAGLGVNYGFGRWFSLRAAYGWQLEAIASSRGVYSGYGHIAASIGW